MDLLDRLLGHDAWTTRQLLQLCLPLSDEQLDRPFDMGHRTLRATFDHLIWNMEVWSALMEGEHAPPPRDRSIPGFLQRLNIAAERLTRIANSVRASNAWDELWLDDLDNPPNQKSFGTAIAHLITHSMHHRAQLLYLMRLSGVTGIPEGDVFSWENQSAMQQSE